MAMKLILACTVFGLVFGSPPGLKKPGFGRPPSGYGRGGFPPSTEYPGCVDFFVDVPVDYEYYKLKFPPFTSQSQATDLLLQGTSRTPSNPNDALSGPFNASEKFKISARYCPASSKSNEHDGTLLLLTHGIGFDKSYWSFDYPANDPKNYSFTYHANKAGFATLSYDRLGVGLSPKADPYDTIQAQVELALLKSITTLTRSGNLSKAIPKPSKVIHIGHSWGSQLSNDLIATDPSLSDAAILTGYSNFVQYQAGFIISSGWHIASLTVPQRFAGLSSGYLTWGDAVSNQYSFLKYPFYDEGVLEQAEATKQPFTIGEFLTGQKITPPSAPAFKNPVLLLAAEYDLIFCGANCTHDLIDGPARAAYPVAQLTTYIQPDTGHGMNLHHNATGWYGYVFEWLSDNGF